MTTRTRTEAIQSIEYCIRLYSLHQRFHANAAKWVTFIELFAGSGAFFAALGDQRIAVMVAGLLIAVMAAANHAWSFTDRSRDFGDIVKAMVLARTECEGRTTEQIDAAMDLAQLDAPPRIEGLRVPAYNDMLRQTGQEAHVRKLTLWHWLMWKIA